MLPIPASIGVFESTLYYQTTLWSTTWLWTVFTPWPVSGHWWSLSPKLFLAQLLLLCRSFRVFSFAGKNRRKWWKVARQPSRSRHTLPRWEIGSWKNFHIRERSFYYSWTEISRIARRVLHETRRKEFQERRGGYQKVILAIERAIEGVKGKGFQRWRKEFERNSTFYSRSSKEGLRINNSRTFEQFAWQTAFVKLRDIYTRILLDKICDISVAVAVTEAMNRKNLRLIISV